MLLVGLTGNIASGKSTVAQLFARWGATLIDADAPGAASGRTSACRPITPSSSAGDRA